MKYDDETRARMNAVYGLLFKNRGQYFKSPEIEKHTGLSGPIVRDTVNKIRSEGYPIIANSNGYKYATKRAELDHCIASLYSRINSIAEAARGLVLAREKYFGGQLEFDIDKLAKYHARIKKAIAELEQQPAAQQDDLFGGAKARPNAGPYSGVD